MAIAAAAILVLFGLALAWFVAMRKKYNALFNPAHLREFGEVLLQQRKVALANPNRDPSGSLTSSGLVVLYTVDLRDGLFRHHVSLSWRGAFFAQAAAGAYLCFLQKLLQLPSNGAVSLFQTSAGRYHVCFQLGADEHARNASVEPELPPPEHMPALLQECNERKGRLLPIRVVDISTAAGPAAA
jgi:hypothetical protein